MKTNDSDLEKEEVLMENKKVEGTEAISTDSPDAQLWSTCIRKLIRALAATLIGGTLVYFICRWFIR